ncbi:ropporin-1-like [Daktulosphaira vitifoliae]|uniref:ropporin-1-like n=1 Tax=Daktulosphaira vitifoliae TaxID=58002 RepID=UPI0021AA803B|nr:ropporin-1-like [Daktulosphaira vitifoliae]
MTSVEVPDTLPNILKEYVKAAILSQPEDILRWSADYFKTVEDFPQVSQMNNKCYISRNRTLYRILVFQLGTTLNTKERIKEVWTDLNLEMNLLDQIYKIGQFDGNTVDMIEFIGITIGHWSKSLKDTMIFCCEAFCKYLTSDGYYLPVDVICRLYTYLAKLDCSHISPIDHIIDTGADILKQRFEKGRGSLLETSKSFDVSAFASYPSRTITESNYYNKPHSFDSVNNLQSEAFTESNKINGCKSNLKIKHSGYHVPGIGATVSEYQIQNVLEYFKKCSVINNGCVYDFNITDNTCPQLDSKN